MKGFLAFGKLEFMRTPENIPQALEAIRDQAIANSLRQRKK